MNNRNPYTLSFGRIPNEYISRDIIISDILDGKTRGEVRIILPRFKEYVEMQVSIM